MIFESILDQDPPFTFKSYFRYSKVPGSEDVASGFTHFPETTKDSSKDDKQTFARLFILTLVYATFILTLPFSVWFCIRKVKALERCIIFRLGQRLPLKGPGLVITFPCLDVLHIIDLNPQKIVVMEDQHLLTNDSSVVSVKEFEALISVSDAIRSFTQLRDSKHNVEQFIRLSFTNLIASTHVEDLETKLDYVIKNFVSNCNLYLNHWGWDMSCLLYPKITVVTRADPVNPLMDALKSYFNPGGNSSGQTSSVNMNSLNTLFGATPSSGGKEETATDDKFLDPLRHMAAKYSSFSGMLGHDTIVICVDIKSEKTKSYYRFTTRDSSIQRIQDESSLSDSDVKLEIAADTTKDFMEFIETGDSSYVHITNRLF